MEPMDIDWKNIESVFIKDDLYEHINAPKYVNLSALEESVDDDAWFCRPDCRHPKNADDFKVKHLRSVSCSEAAPLGERNRCRDANTKRRGATTSENPRSRKPAKDFRENGENENPNLSSLASPKGLKIAKSKALKSTIKSSAEKDKDKENERNPSEAISDSTKKEEKVQLKSTNSARNLFGGREILSQITEFCNELKKMALNRSDREDSMEKEKEPLIEEEKVVLGGVKEKTNLNAKIFRPEAWRKKKKMMDGTEHTQEVLEESDLSGKRKGDKGILQVRSCPPSPQQFSSPLKPPKSRIAKKGILEELERTQVTTNKPSNISIPNVEVRPVDVLWFLKPCAYLGR
ncbi:hypothetical protein MRB53_006933 [Persea americana]|uniref:Uncharacterized protein n=1 Tax=Persea americana TaxID=3435 RepID=A0ACC2MIE3_PERAE|nr:hypothetical protein MRB53_006933 [Persea americana]